MGKKNNYTKSELAEVRGSIVHGRGMFATQNIPESTEIIEYLGERIDKEESNRRGHALFDESKETGGAQVYLFTLDDEWDLDGNFEWNTARQLIIPVSLIVRLRLMRNSRFGWLLFGISAKAKNFLLITALTWRITRSIRVGVAVKIVWGIL